MPRLNALLAAGLIAAAALAFFALFMAASGRWAPLIAPPPESDFLPPELRIESARFSDIKGWRDADLTEALGAFRRSCSRLLALDEAAPANPSEALGPAFEGLSLAGDVADWTIACRASPPRSAAARAFFEREFAPVRILSVKRPKPDAAKARRPISSTVGLFTGYFEPTYPASRLAEGRFAAALLQRPADLVTVDLGAFREELAGQRVAGFVEEGALKPYPDHAAINSGALGERAEILAWLDPNDLFFLQIQGSGRLVFPDGAVMRVGYDGQNGRPYTAIGKPLIERGAIPRDKISMQTIRSWLDAAPPAEARRLREINQSYVFFREIEGDASQGPPGAEEIPLTAGASLAVDRRYHAMGLPVWLSFEGDEAGFAGLYVAQDTGGAIRGPLRGDIFVGSGDEAGEIAGALKAQGEMIVFLPRPVAARLARPQ